MHVVKYGGELCKLPVRHFYCSYAVFCLNASKQYIFESLIRQQYELYRLDMTEVVALADNSTLAEPISHGLSFYSRGNFILAYFQR